MNGIILSFVIVLFCSQVAVAADEVYVIKSGETLSHVSDKYRIKMAKIMEANGMKSTDVKVGQKIIIPKDAVQPVDVKKVDSSKKVPENVKKDLPKAKDLPAKSEDLAQKTPVKVEEKAATGEVRYESHTIAKGETLSHVSDKYRVKIAKIMEANNMKSQNVWIGMKLRVPMGDNYVAKSDEKPVVEKKDDVVIAKVEDVKVKTSKENRFLYPSKSRSISKIENGINISSTEDFSVFASKKGIVIYVGDGVENLKKLVIIKHDKKYTTLYGNLVDVVVSQGDNVSDGQKIGYFAKSKPMFFAIRENSVFISDVEKYLD
ncbi:M23 family metallopeptidase [Candidatus Deianiraea vastatrix]|uniref:Murein endopeptidase n=1 Tax=Candidatus Deianiraea vastatrix TaxID=2163644 RepID=A0A5B8XHI0_9RICK|nr:M23 family metallopeptidase [Candidatus Deianiraea vastatrix]QED23551.1 Putative murein endopeptidase [Candidatus Deianiraea vastatrix]